MPFYDYKCTNKNCNNIETDIWEKPNDKINRQCSKCGSKLERQIGNIVGINFKNLPKGHNLSATERRRLFNSTDPKKFRQVM